MISTERPSDLQIKVFLVPVATATSNHKNSSPIYKTHMKKVKKKENMGFMQICQHAFDQERSLSTVCACLASDLMLCQVDLHRGQTRSVV